MKIKETKQKIDGSLQTFECTIRSISPNHAVINHIWHRQTPYVDGPAYLPAAEIHTTAFYWASRDFVIYRMTTAAGNLLGTRIDAAENITISENEIFWRDLVLDFWISPESKFFVLDEQELAEAVSKKLLSPAQIEKIEATRNYLEQNFHNILLEISGDKS
jgi:predicted RNA-binding protein associated with RNAse of E/G family